jgi:hypothetical protein
MTFEKPTKPHKMKMLIYESKIATCGTRFSSCGQRTSSFVEMLTSFMTISTTFASSYEVLLPLRTRLAVFVGNFGMLVMPLVRVVFSLSSLKTWTWSCMRLTNT